MKSEWRRMMVVWGVCAWGVQGWAGGSGLNIAVVVNQSNSNSVKLGNYYCEKRQVPPQNLLRVNWPGSASSWGTSDLNTVLLQPLLAMLQARQLTGQIDYVMLSMGIPYTVSGGAAPNGTTSVLFYGFKADTNPPCSLAPGSSNMYVGSEMAFRDVLPAGSNSPSFLATMITASNNLTLAEEIVDQGVLGDATFPTQTVYLVKTGDSARNVRYVEFDNAIFETRLRGNYAMTRINASSPDGLGSILGFQCGNANFIPTGLSVVPGGIADNLTSYGGEILSNSGQVNLLSFLAAGAAGSYGTVAEPCNYLEKFPSSLVYFYQARGFNLAEGYYQSVTNPYQGLLMGDPLTAPFASPPTGTWLGLPVNSLLAGLTNLSLEFDAVDAAHPVQQVDLFVDGTYFETLTNLAPHANNIVNAQINGKALRYILPANGTLNSVAAGLAGVLNASSGLTKVTAAPCGDRIELISNNPYVSGSQQTLWVSSQAGSSAAATVYITASGTNFLDTVATGVQGFQVGGTPGLGDYLELDIFETNGTTLSVAATNTAAGASLSTLLQALISRINAAGELQGAEGVIAADFQSYTSGGPMAQFNLYARSAGWGAAQVQAELSGAPSLTISPGGYQTLDANLRDLLPRAHLYLTAGLASLPLTFALDTTALADGYHELAAVAYEGSSVRTQGKATQIVCIRNTSLLAALTTPFGGSNVASEATIPFAVAADSSAVAKIELFGTGGSLGSVAGQSNATFSVSGPGLGEGLHPFYALVTAGDGAQYRTATLWLRLVGPDAPFPLALTAPPPALAWPATAGRSYEILTSSNANGSFQASATITATNGGAQWVDSGAAAQRYYRVRTTR